MAPLIKALLQRPLLILMGLFVVLATTFSLTLPLGEAADEVDHLALVQFIANTGRPPLTQAEREAIGKKGDASPIYHSLVAYSVGFLFNASDPALPLQTEAQRYIPYDGFHPAHIFHTATEHFPFAGLPLAWHVSRLWSVLLGLGTVLGVYYCARLLEPSRPNLALLSAGLIAFTPRFLINSSVITDDALVVFLTTWGLYFGLSILQGQQRHTRYLLTGLVLGLAFITKYHAILLIGLFFVMSGWYSYRQGQSVAQSSGWLVWFGAGVLISAGWWFGFLILQFNQIDQLGLVAGLLAPLGDPVSSSVATNGLGAWFSQPSTWFTWIEPLFQTYWFTFGGTQVFASTWVYQLLSGLMVVIVLGWVYAGFRGGWRTLWFRLDVIFLLGAVMAYLGLIIVRYQAQPVLFAAQGRHLYPVVAALGVFLAFGLREASFLLTKIAGRYLSGLTLFRNRHLFWQHVLFGVGLNLFLLLTVIQPLYRPYLPLSYTLPPPEARLANPPLNSPLPLIGLRLPSDTIFTGDVLPFTLYWQTTPIKGDYLIESCLQDSLGQTVLCRHSYPADGRYPTRAWEAGYILPDTLSLPVPTCLASGIYDLRISLLPLKNEVAAPSINQTEEVTILYQQSLPVSIESRPLMLFSLFQNTICLTDNCYTSSGLNLQPRQSFTLLNYHSTETLPNAVLMAKNGADFWPPFQKYRYPCSANTVVSTESYLVSPTLSASRYQLEVNNRKTPLALNIPPSARVFQLTQVPAIPLQAEFGQTLTLLGYQTDFSSKTAGQTATLQTYWRVNRYLNEPYYLSVHLQDYNQQNYAVKDQPLISPTMKDTILPGQILSHTHHLPIAENTPSGLYNLQLSVYTTPQAQSPSNLPEPLTFQHLPITAAIPSAVITPYLALGQWQVNQPENTPNPETTLAVTFKNNIQLLGYDLDIDVYQPQAEIALRLYWQTLNPVPNNYTVFTQLIGPDGRVWSQQDNQPQQNRLPTSLWTPYTLVIDNYQLDLSNISAGNFQLLVGLYDLESGERLSAYSSTGQPYPNQAVLLETIEFQ